MRSISVNIIDLTGSESAESEDSERFSGGFASFSCRFLTFVDILALKYTVLIGR